MRRSSTILANLRARLPSAFRWTNIVGAVAVVVVAASAIFADLQNRVVSEQQLRASVTRQVNVLRARLEGNINGDLQLVRGLIGTLTTEPDMSADRFATLAAHLFEEHSQLRDIAVAPGLKVSMVYPLKGNEKVLGVDYTQVQSQRDMAYRARDTGQLVFAGPVDLIQGGTGFVGRFPVFTLSPTRPRSFWGVVSAVVDAPRLYADSGLIAPDLDVDVAISRSSGDGGGSGVFFGSKEVLNGHPVIADVNVPQGFWQIGARPLGGWEAALPNPLLFRIGLAFAAALVIFPLWLAARRRRPH